MVAIGVLAIAVLAGVYAVHAWFPHTEQATSAEPDPRPTVSASLAVSASPVVSPSSIDSSSIDSSPAESARPAKRITIAMVGDLELGNTPVLPPDPSNYLTPVRSALAAPVVFGNLEGTLSNGDPAKCATPTPSISTAGTSPAGSSSSATPSASPSVRTCYAFRVPPMYARILRDAGFTVLSSANNHSSDLGRRGITDTTAALRSAGIAQTGLPDQIAVVEADGVRVAVVGFAPYRVTTDLLDEAVAARLIAKAKTEADVVVVYMHAGAEGSLADHVTGKEEWYAGEDRGNPREFAHAAVDAGADLVVGSGPHVLRGMEFYRGHLIAYSLGDFAGYRNFSTRGPLGLSAVLHATLGADGRLVSASFTSLVLNADGRPSVDPARAAADFVNQLSAADFGAAAATISPSGSVSVKDDRG